ncbi:MAG: FAD-dependent oxidoreductase, partial [Thermoguttaceae bacterium]|nr:FAD-dependent oxidoreductase [Thermoguttaceae bacterium]
MKTVIIGGVAAGASAAARLRRLDEAAEIVLFEKGEFISYANCGLPYCLGGVIPERENLLVMTSEKFRAWLNVDVRTSSEAIAINRAEKTVLIQNGNREYTERYDKLVLATGAIPTAPKTPGDDDPRVLRLWTIADMDRVLSKLNAGAKRAVVVGAGFVGLELAENLRERGLDVTIVQRSDHVLPTLDSETAVPLAVELSSLGIALEFGRVVSSYHAEGDAFFVDLDSGEKLQADFVVVSVGVRPNSALAQDAGLECGDRGHIVVNEYLQTSDPDIYAAGDAVEVLDPIFGGKRAFPLAGPANKQGRIVADNIAGRPSRYSGSLGTSVVKVGALTAASVGLTEKRLIALKKPYRKIYIHPSSNASYFPGATRLDLKLLFGDDGTIYGAKFVGRMGVDKRIDSIAQAMKSGKKAPELGELELAYAPPYSSAKDPVNFAGFVADDVLTGLSDVVYPDTIPEDAVVLDVREPAEHELGAIPGSLNIPLGQLRTRLNELDKSKLIVCHCQVGLRGYLAERILKQNGFRAANLSGG